MEDRILKLEEKIKELRISLEEYSVELGGPGSGRRPGGGGGAKKPEGKRTPVSTTQAARDRANFKSFDKEGHSKEASKFTSMKKEASLAGDTPATNYFTNMAEAHASAAQGDPKGAEKALDAANRAAYQADKAFRKK